MTRSVAITGAPTLRNLAEIWPIPDALVISKFSKIFSTDITSTLCKNKNDHTYCESSNYTIQCFWLQIFWIWKEKHLQKNRQHHSLLMIVPQSNVFFLMLTSFLSESIAYLKSSLSVSLPGCLIFYSAYHGFG